MPLPYFEPLSAAFAFATLPRSPGVAYGSYSESWLSKSVSGTMWCATWPIVGPPHAWTSACLSMTQFIALRTWMSSNGGWVRFIVRYQVRSPEFRWSDGFLLESVAYERSTCAGMLEISSWKSPAATLLRMSSALVSTSHWKLSGRFWRAAVVSVFGSYCGFRTSVRCVWPSKPLIGLIVEQDEMSTAAAPLIMYGPVETTSRPYLPGWPSKHFATSFGIGPVAGIESR